MLLAIIASAAVPYGTVEPWWNPLFERIVLALGVLWMIEGMLSGSWLRTTHRIFMPLLFPVLYIFIQTVPLLPEARQGGGLTWGSY